MEEEKYKYIQFPNCLLMETYRGIEEGLRLILRYGIVNYAKNQPFTLADVARQTCYDYYRNQALLQGSVIATIGEVEKENRFTRDEDSDGFFDTTFNPEQEISELLLLFQEDFEFKENCILNYQIHLAIAPKQLNVRIHSYDEVIRTFNEGKRLQEEFENRFGPDAMPFIKISMLLDFIHNPKDIDLFRAYVGIKSMIGRRNFISSNKPAILSRMIGCKSKAAFIYYTSNKYNRNKFLLPTVEKYSKRYHMDKLLFTLAQRKYIMFLSRKDVSVLYLSRYMEPEELAQMIKNKKAKDDLKSRIRNATAGL